MKELTAEVLNGISGDNSLPTVVEELCVPCLLSPVVWRR